MTELPAARQFITEDEINEALSGGSGVSEGKLRIYAYFTEDHTAKEKASFLKEEYGTGGHSHAVSHADSSYEDHSSKGIRFKKGDCAEVQLNWSNVVRRVDDLIRKRRYLSPEEKAKFSEMEREYGDVGGIPTPQARYGFPKPETLRQAQKQTEPTSYASYEDYKAVKDAHTDDIVLYQVGDFFELYGADAETAEVVLELTPTTRNLNGERIPMCGIPANQLEQYVEKLQDEGFDVTISGIEELNKQRRVFSLPSVDHEAERATDEHEAEFGADGTRAFPGNAPKQSTEQVLLAQYKPVVIATVSEDTRYRNACGHSDRENAEIECNAAVRRAVLNSGDMELIRLFSDMPEFRSSLHQEVFDETYPRLHELLRPLSQDDIDAALQRWNGDIASKRRVQDYMADHARDKDTAAWLSREYSGSETKSLFVVRTGSPEEMELPWSKVQRRIAQLISSNNFLSEQEMLPARYQVVVYHHLENGFDEKLDYQTLQEAEKAAQGYVDGTLESDGFAYDGAAIYDLQEKQYLRVFGDYPDDAAIAATQPVQETTPIQTTAELDLTDTDLQDVLTGDGGLLNYQAKDKIGGWFRDGEDNAAIAQRLGDAYAGTAETMPLLSGETADYFASTNGLAINIHDKFNTDLSFGWNEIAPVLRAMYEQERDGFSHEPMLTQAQTAASQQTAFPYAVGDTIYLEGGKPFLVTEVRDTSIQLQDPTLFYPIFRAESVESFARLMERFPQKEREAPDILPPADNFRITDDNLGAGGAKVKFQMNMAAINLLKELELDGRQAMPEEQEVLSKYVGWGGLADAFDENKPAWANEFQELYATLSPEEYAAARSSTLNAHYTSPAVIRAIYEAVENMGFQTGNILEPSMGVGNFFGLLPDNMAGSKLYGVELDSITGRIAKQLYPKADITVAGFETTDRKDFFDLAIGNVPFGQYGINDRAYNKLGFSIHNYFFAKALDQVRPGGVVAFVTSRYTMDAKDSSARKYLAKRADFLGAVRLPNNAFRANAGTDVVSDIIFLQKRDRPITIEPDWVHLGENKDGFAINSYFTEHPEMILGNQSSESTQYGHQDFTVTPIEGAVLADQLHDAIQNIGGQYAEAEMPELGEGEEIDDSIPADPDVKNFSYTVVDDKVYYRENSRMVRPTLNATAEGRVKGMVELRDCVQKLIGQQLDGFVSDAAIRQTQAELNDLYDSFTAKYGLINSRGNALAFSDDSSYYLLCSLEMLTGQ